MSSIGPVIPHTWVTAGGVHVSGGDTVEFRVNDGPRHDPKWKRVTAKVNKLLIFDDHVQVNRGTFGETVDDGNFIRVVRKASRGNPTNTVSVRVYFRGKPAGEIREIPARFFRWHPANKGKKTYRVGDAPLSGALERARDRYVDLIAPGNVGWEEVHSSSRYRDNPRRAPRVGQIVSVAGRAVRITKVLGKTAGGHTVMAGGRRLSISWHSGGGEWGRA